MSVEITTAFVNQYNANVQLLSQQRSTRLRAAVREESINGKQDFFDQIGATAARKRPSRHSDTPRMDTPHDRRMVTTASYDWADLIDKEDKVRMLIDPTSTYAINAAAAMNRSMDDEVIAAALGTAYTGEQGTTTVSLPSTQKIASGGAGLTIAKLIQAKKLFLANEVGTDMEEELFITVSSYGLEDLLNTTQVTSRDYNTVRALVRGEIDTFMGFKFIHTERLSRTASTESMFAWAKSGLLLAVGINPTARISERDDKNYATQVFYSMDVGATRMEEKKVVQIDIDIT